MGQKLPVPYRLCVGRIWETWVCQRTITWMGCIEDGKRPGAGAPGRREQGRWRGWGDGSQMAQWAGDGLGESGAGEASETAAALVVEHWLKWKGKDRKHTEREHTP